MSLQQTVEPSMLFGVPFSKKPTPNKDKTRYYACELKWNAWHCKPTNELEWKASPDTLVTQVITVNNWVPEILDPAVVSYKLKKPVFIGKK